jgi:hypothetical protein
MLGILWVPLGFKITVLPRRILFGASLGIFADEDRRTDATIIVIGFGHPDGLAACVANAVVLHDSTSHTQIRSC